MSAMQPFALLSRGGDAGRLLIFIFHRVLAQPDPLMPTEPDAARFENIVAFIARHFRVLPLSEAARRLVTGALPKAAACITFDDGYADNLSIAAPILRRHGAVATIFIATRYSEGGWMWNDSVIECVRRAPGGEIDWTAFGLGRHVLGDDASRRGVIDRVLGALKYRDPAERGELVDELIRQSGVGSTQQPMLTPPQIRQLRDLGMEIGGHTVSHPILGKLDDRAAQAEIEQGRERLAHWLGEAPTAFAYPNGVPGRDYGSRDVALVRRAGYRCAVSTAWGAATAASDVFQLPRSTPWDRSTWRFGLRCARTLLAPAPVTASV